MSCHAVQDLELTGMDLALVEDQQLFTALTASSELTALHISEDEEVVSVFPELTDNGHRLTLNTPLPLPPQALVSALPLGKQWPQLCSLHIKRAPYNPANWCIEAMDMAVIANTLPALANLSLLRVVRDSGVVSGLAALPHLTQLCIGGDAFDDTAAAVVAKVTTLRDLQLISAPVTTAGLQELTALRGLTLLLLEDLPDVGKGLFPVRANGTEEKTLSLTTNSEVRRLILDVCTNRMCTQGMCSLLGVPHVARRVLVAMQIKLIYGSTASPCMPARLSAQTCALLSSYMQEGPQLSCFDGLCTSEPGWEAISTTLKSSMCSLL